MEETLAHLEKLTSYEERRYFVQHSYHDRGLLNHILDDGKLVNHSDTPNAGPGAEPLSTYAVREGLRKKIRNFFGNFSQMSD